MIMKPLLLHASNRTTNNNKRRVIHVEFSNRSLADRLQWSEKESMHVTVVAEAQLHFLTPLFSVFER